MKARFAISLLLLIRSASVVLAHEGKSHVMGTVSAIDAERIVVTDRDGKTVSMALTNETKYAQGETPAAASAVKVGTRIVVDVTGTTESLTATEIRIAPSGGGHADGTHEGQKDYPHGE